MKGIEALYNTGIRFIGEPQALKEDEKTFIVVGVARGGTSLVAGSLHHLGIFAGDKSVAPVFEDVRLATAFESNDLNNAKEIITEYNDKYSQWVFKRPKAVDYLDKINREFRNPIYLFIFKDIFSISNRNALSMKNDLLNGLMHAHAEYSKILKFISKNDLNAFLFSYDKVMSNKEEFVDVLIDVIGIKNVTAEQKQKALEFIEPNPKAYLDASRINRGQGQIGKVTKTLVQGWAKYVYSDNFAEVELYINDILKKTGRADEFRQGALDAKVHPTGHCGYTFDLSDCPLNHNDKVSVKLKDDIVFLKGSEYFFKEK